MHRLFADTFLLVRFLLCRDRVWLLSWLIGIIAFVLFCVPLLQNMLGTPSELAVMGQMMENPAMVAMVGPVFDVQNYTMGAMYANMMLVLMVTLAGAMNIFFVTRHTRQDEELGRYEVIRALPVGRLAPLGATLLVAVKFNVLMALCIGFGMLAFGIDTMPFLGTLLFGAAMGAVGLVFAAITAIFCQLVGSNRTASGLSLLMLMLAYALRGVGDVAHVEALAVLSPIGLASRTQVFVSNQLWPLAALLGTALVCSIAAMALNERRDLEQGMIPARPGSKYGGMLLTNPLGLALRLTRTMCLAWCGVLVTFGVMYGSVLNEVQGFIEGSAMLQAIFTQTGGQSVTDQFVALLMVIMSVMAAVPTIGLMLRLRAEEKQGFTEQILGTSVSRVKLFGVYFGISFGASVVLQVLAALSFWGAASVVMDVQPALSTYLQAALNYLPAIWVMLGLTALLIGVLPRLTALSYGYLGISFFIIYIGTVAGFPDWTQNLSPFGIVPQVPIEAQTWVPLFVLCGIATLLGIVGAVGYRRRDLRLN